MGSKYLFERLNKLDYNHHLAIVEAKNKHQKALLRVYANRYDLNYNILLHDDFDHVIYYQCNDCKKNITRNEMIWTEDFNIKMFSEKVTRYLGGCPKCLNKDNFTVWSPTNSIIIGKNLGKYARNLSKRELKQKEGDKTWKLERLKHFINKIKDNKLIILPAIIFDV